MPVDNSCVVDLDSLWPVYKIQFVVPAHGAVTVGLSNQPSLPNCQAQVAAQAMGEIHVIAAYIDVAANGECFAGECVDGMQVPVIG
jgi:hypothetical protein